MYRMPNNMELAADTALILHAPTGCEARYEPHKDHIDPERRHSPASTPFLQARPPMASPFPII